jgi:hypothetical protein
MAPFSPQHPCIHAGAMEAAMGNVLDNRKLAIWFALYDLETTHWADVDFNGGANAHELYCADGVLAVGPNRFDGRKGVRRFYEWRRSRGETSSRHIISNMMVNSHTERRATATGVITIHRGKGAQPIAYGNVPALVADFTSECVRGPNDEWLYASHIIDPVFVGSDLPLSLAIDPRYLDSIQSDDNAGRDG